MAGVGEDDDEDTATVTVGTVGPGAHVDIGTGDATLACFTIVSGVGVFDG